MNKIITYGVIGALSFGTGSCYQKNKIKETVAGKKYDTFQQKNQWFLSTPAGDRIITKTHEVGTVEERMKGLLKEEYISLKESLEKIVKKD